MRTGRRSDGIAVTLSRAHLVAGAVAAVVIPLNYGWATAVALTLGIGSGAAAMLALGKRVSTVERQVVYGVGLLLLLVGLGMALEHNQWHYWVLFAVAFVGCLGGELLLAHASERLEQLGIWLAMAGLLAGYLLLGIGIIDLFEPGGWPILLSALAMIAYGTPTARPVYKWVRGL